MFANDTIIAFSSIPAPSARILLRLSGPEALNLAGVLMNPPPPTPCFSGIMHQCRLALRGLCFPAWVYLFTAPNSYTGEDIVELHLPGNVLIARWTMEEMIHRGARPAGPGEFTARAYFNGRMDLNAAEGVAATIAAGNERELRASRQLLAGELARHLRPIMDDLAQTLALTEVGIDFSEEDVVILDSRETIRRINRIDTHLHDLLSKSRRFAHLSHEPTIVLTGRPNAGKSTLLNALSGRQRAVVSPIAGTTRDLLSVRIALAHGMVNLVDAAGIDTDETDTARQQDVIAAAMRQKALTAIEQGDILIHLRETGDTRPELRLSRKPDLHVHTKADLQANPHPDGLTISALTGQGLSELRQRLDELAFGEARGGQTLALNDRHLDEIRHAQEALRRAAGAILAGAELVALELREALNALGAVLGQVSPDELLGRIFSTFCIGK